MRKDNKITCNRCGEWINPLRMHYDIKPPYGTMPGKDGVELVVGTHRFTDCIGAGIGDPTVESRKVLMDLCSRCWNDLQEMIEAFVDDKGN